MMNEYVQIKGNVIVNYNKNEIVFSGLAISILINSIISLLNK
jgi:hypothetical protein